MDIQNLKNDEIKRALFDIVYGILPKYTQSCDCLSDDEHEMFFGTQPKKPCVICRAKKLLEVA